MNHHLVIRQAFDRSLRACAPEYRARHSIALGSPSNALEKALGSMLVALGAYAEAHEARYESKVMDDGVLGPAWADMLRGFRTLLNGETGRFDAGALDSAACDLYKAAGGEDDL